MSQLKGKVAIVTGGGTGIGLAICEGLMQQGVNVVLSSRTEPVLAEQTEIFNKQYFNDQYGAKAIAIAADVRNKSQVQQLVGGAIEEFGKIDFLINNAGLGVTDKIIDCPEENWDLVLDTCTKGTFLMCQAVLPHMQEQKDGFIINIASQAALNGYSEAGPYCAAKFGVLGLGMALQEEVREYGIKIHSLCPGLVQVPKPGSLAEHKDGWLQTEDLAAATLFLLQQPKRVFFDNIGLWGFPTS